jgi:hypothetical protein
LDGLGVEVMIAHRLVYDAMLPHKSLSQFCGSSGRKAPTGYKG